MAEDDISEAEEALPAGILRFISTTHSKLDGFWNSMISDSPELRLSDACGTLGDVPFG